MGSDLTVGALLGAVPGSSCEPRSQCCPRSMRDSSRVDDGNVTPHEIPGENKGDVTLGPRANGADTYTMMDRYCWPNIVQVS
jgi:hypothetical protein